MGYTIGVPIGVPLYCRISRKLIFYSTRDYFPSYFLLDLALFRINGLQVSMAETFIFYGLLTSTFSQVGAILSNALSYLRNLRTISCDRDNFFTAITWKWEKTISTEK